ncbi:MULTISPECIES: hypothetical protein [unclassified Clostridium]|uniref:hypothetical protein n=1 Tax=Clostridium TaxID=1485 RepID=UPI0021AB2207|nr:MULTISPECIES: hypothetical protein [unclassified Clostridium]MDU2288997.1 hypothetical protein [Clostridium celatum]
MLITSSCDNPTVIYFTPSISSIYDVLLTAALAAVYPIALSVIISFFTLYTVEFSFSETLGVCVSSLSVDSVGPCCPPLPPLLLFGF